MTCSARASMRGRNAIVTERWRGLRWTLRRQAGFARRTKTQQRTAKSCGPGAATLASIRAAPWWRGNGGKKGRSPGRARISRKTIARGKPGCLGCTCQTRVRSLTTCCTRRCGRSRRPAFPAPSVQERAKRRQTSGRSCRENESAYPCAWRYRFPPPLLAEPSHSIVTPDRSPAKRRRRGSETKLQ